MVLEWAYGVSVHQLVNLLSANLAVLVRKSLDLVADMLNRARLVNVDMAAFWCNHAVVRPCEHRLNHHNIDLRSANQEVNVGIWAVDVFVNLLTAFLAPLVEAIASIAEARLVCLGEKLQDSWVHSVVVIVTEVWSCVHWHYLCVHFVISSLFIYKKNSAHNTYHSGELC